MHTKELTSLIAKLDDQELDEIQNAIDRRRTRLKQSTVLERRDYRNGILQLESRAYRRKDGTLAERRFYWYYHYREGGKQHTLYVGKTDDPEAELELRLELNRED